MSTHRCLKAVQDVVVGVQCNPRRYRFVNGSIKVRSIALDAHVLPSCVHAAVRTNCQRL